MKLIGALLDLLNGKKMNTGTIMVISVIVLQKVLGIGESEATSMATNIMMGVGGVMALWGYVHRLIKARQAAKPEPK
jgi:uncharacterized membrane protein YuzA (DUF378 family)